jgi:hypothetical protein
LINGPGSRASSDSNDSEERTNHDRLKSIGGRAGLRPARADVQAFTAALLSDLTKKGRLESAPIVSLSKFVMDDRSTKTKD